MMNESFANGLIKVLVVLREYLSEIVVGGGWAPFLYYRYLVKDKSRQPILTRDIDLLVSDNLPTIGTKTVDQLLVEAGLEAKFKSRNNPPIIHYEGVIEGIEVEIEFLTDQTGSRSDLVLEVQKGLHAEALRYASIVVENTMKVTIDDAVSLKNENLLVIKVPTPAAYIFQKGLSFTRRRDKQKMAKDLYYIFDMLAGLPQIRDDIETELAAFSKIHVRWFQTFIGNFKEYFESADAEGPLYVVEQRPAGDFPALDDDQLILFAYGTFEQFIKKLDPLDKV